MTKKHYEAIAATLKAQNASYELVEAMANAIAPFNPKFDHWSFHKAAGQPYVFVVNMDR